MSALHKVQCSSRRYLSLVEPVFNCQSHQCQLLVLVKIQETGPRPKPSYFSLSVRTDFLMSCDTHPSFLDVRWHKKPHLWMSCDKKNLIGGCHVTQKPHLCISSNTKTSFVDVMWNKNLICVCQVTQKPHLCMSGDTKTSFVGVIWHTPHPLTLFLHSTNQLCWDDMSSLAECVRHYV